jgi:hypothetical protein
MAEVDLKTLNDFLLPDLGLVTLNPTLNEDGTATQFERIQQYPTVMGTFENVPHLRYRFDLHTLRMLHVYYLVERNGIYAAGEMQVITNAQQLTRFQDPYTPPDIWVNSNFPDWQTSGTPAYLPFDQTFTNDPAFPLAHNLGVVPILTVMRENTLQAGRWGLLNTSSELYVDENFIYDPNHFIQNVGASPNRLRIICQPVDVTSATRLGVTLGFKIDNNTITPSKTSLRPLLKMVFKITSSSPPVFPTLRAMLFKYLPVENL